MISLTGLPSDGEVCAIAEAVFGEDTPLGYESVRKMLDFFERMGYVLTPKCMLAMAVSPARVVRGRLVIDPLTRLVCYDGRPIWLALRAFDLLNVFAQNPERVFTRAHLLDLVWPPDYDGPERVVDLMIARLRRWIGDPQVIESVPGVGYRLGVRDGPCASP